MAFRDIFDELEPAERVALLDRASALSFAPGDTIIAQDRENPNIYVVRDGEVKVTLQQDGSDEVEVARLGIGSIVGEMAFVTGEVASANVIAVDEVMVLQVGHQHVSEMVSDDPRFAGRFYRSLAMVLAERLRDTNRRL